MCTSLPFACDRSAACVDLPPACAHASGAASLQLGNARKKNSQPFQLMNMSKIVRVRLLANSCFEKQVPYVQSRAPQRLRQRHCNVVIIHTAASLPFVRWFTLPRYPNRLYVLSTFLLLGGNRLRGGLEGVPGHEARAINSLVGARRGSAERHKCLCRTIRGFSWPDHLVLDTAAPSSGESICSPMQTFHRL